MATLVESKMFWLILLGISSAWSYSSDIKVKLPQNDLLEHCLLTIHQLKRNESRDLHLSSIKALENGTVVADFNDELLERVHHLYPVTVSVVEQLSVPITQTGIKNYILIIVHIVGNVMYALSIQ